MFIDTEIEMLEIEKIEIDRRQKGLRKRARRLIENNLMDIERKFEIWAKYVHNPTDIDGDINRVPKTLKKLIGIDGCCDWINKNQVIHVDYMYELAEESYKNYKTINREEFEELVEQIMEVGNFTYDW